MGNDIETGRREDILSKVATLLTRHDDLSTGDNCQITESSSEGFSWKRTTSNYFYQFENWLD